MRTATVTAAVPVAAHERAPAPPVPARKPRLDHVDAMRPVKQAGVISTHVLLAFAPGAAFAVGASLMLLHVTRESFLFVSACMLTYGYYDLARIGYRYFYRRRAISVLLPYGAWTVIYWLVTLPGYGMGPGSDLGHLGYLFASGYYQLYYLVVIMQFYAVFPLLFWLLRRTEGHHLAVLAVSLGVQVALTALMHWHVAPPAMRGHWGTREITSYQFYLLAGMVSALHLSELHAWVCRNGWRVFGATVAAALAAEAWYLAAAHRAAGWLGSGSDPFQPVVIPFNVGAIACLYLFGVWLVAPERPRRLRAMVRSGSDNSYGVYLAQMVFILLLGGLAWRSLDHVMPWPLVSALAVGLVFGACVLLTSALARTPLAVGLTGRTRQSWATWLPEGLRRADRAPGHSVVSPIDVDPAVASKG